MGSVFLGHPVYNFNTPVYVVVLSPSMEMAEYIVSKINQNLLTMDTYLCSTSIVRRTLL